MSSDGKFEFATHKPPGTMVDEAGCGALQLLEMTCEAPSWANHGRYVSCVAKVSEDAYRKGLLTKKERDAILRQAARSSKFK